MTRETAVSTPSTSKSHSLQAWLAELRDAKWPWVVLPGLAVVIINIATLPLIIDDEQ